MHQFTRVRDIAIMPEPANHAGDAGIDLAIPEGITVHPRKQQKVKLGLKWEPPQRLKRLVPMLKLEPRSSTALMWNLLVQPGVVDAGYTGELSFVVINFSDEAAIVPRGKRLVQAVLHWVSEAPNEEKERGPNGFGTTD